MIRHKNLWLSCHPDDVDYRIQREMRKRPFASTHEMYAVLREELDEFWDSVKHNDPDPGELLQICAVAKSALLQLCDQAREEMSSPRSGEGRETMDANRNRRYVVKHKPTRLPPKPQGRK